MMSDPHPQPTMLDYALDYLARGWPVFPVCRPVREGRCEQHGACKNAGKHPLVGWEAYQSRLPAHTEVTAWWRRWPTANIGMATGALSGVIVLDCDGSDARKAALERGVPPTPTIFTGKPGGVHYHLAHPGFAVQNFARKLPGLDFRGDGGYVLLPPSHHARGADYRWVPDTEAVDRALPPDWLLDLIHGRTESASTPSDRPGLDLVALLDGVPEGERDDTLYRFACRLRGDNVPREYADFMVRQAARACRPAFDEDAAVDKVARAYAQYSPTLQLVVPAALAEPSPAPAPYLVKQIGASRQVAADTPPALMQGLIWSGKTHWLYSAPGAGKTMLMLAAALHIAAGQPFSGRRVEPAAALLIEEDSPESVLGEYVTTLGELYPDLPLDTVPLYYNAVQGLRLTDADGLEKIRAAVAACPIPPQLVVIDTCEKVLPSQEFSSRELAPLVALCQELTARGIALVVIDHTRKSPPSSDKGKQAAAPSDDQLIDLLYGGRQKSGMSDVMLYLTGSLTRGKIAGRFVKFRGATPEPITLKWAADAGFAIDEPPRRARTPSEEKVLAFMNGHGQAPFARRDVCAATGLAEATVKNVLAEFLRRNWASKSGDGSGTKYAPNDITPSGILELAPVPG